MSTDDHELLRLVAEAIVRQFGADAPAVAEQQAMLAGEDRSVAGTWRKIELLAREFVTDA